MSLHRLQVDIVSAKCLPGVDGGGKYSDPYVKFDFKGTEYRTKSKSKTKDPNWNESFLINWDPQVGPHVMYIEVWDSNTFTKDIKLGNVSVTLSGLVVNQPKDGWYTFDSVRCGAEGAVLRVRLKLHLPSIQCNPFPKPQVIVGYPQGQHVYQQPPAYYQPPQYGVCRSPYSPPCYGYTQNHYPYGQYPNVYQPMPGYEAHLWKQAVEAVESSSSNSSTSSSDEERKKKKKKDKKEKKLAEAKPELMLDIKDTLPQANYKQIARALRETGNDKSKALQKLVLIIDAEGADPRLKELREAAKGD